MPLQFLLEERVLLLIVDQVHGPSVVGHVVECKGCSQRQRKHFVGAFYNSCLSECVFDSRAIDVEFILVSLYLYEAHLIALLAGIAV